MLPVPGDRDPHAYCCCLVTLPTLCSQIVVCYKYARFRQVFGWVVRCDLTVIGKSRYKNCCIIIPLFEMILGCYKSIFHPRTLAQNAILLFNSEISGGVSKPTSYPKTMMCYY